MKNILVSRHALMVLAAAIVMIIVKLLATSLTQNPSLGPPWETVGRIKVISLHLRPSPARNGNSVVGENSPQLFRWLSAGNQAEYGDVLVRSLWSDNKSSALLSMRADAACRYISFLFGADDSLTPTAGFLSRPYLMQHQCQVQSTGNKSRARYDFAIAPARCSMSGIAIALIKTNGKDAPESFVQARVKADAPCISLMKEVSRWIIAVTLIFSCVTFWLVRVTWARTGP